MPISKPPAYETDYWQQRDYDDDGGGNEITVTYPRYPRTNPHSSAARVPSSVYLGDEDYGYKVSYGLTVSPQNESFICQSMIC